MTNVSSTVSWTDNNTARLRKRIEVLHSSVTQKYTRTQTPQNLTKNLQNINCTSRHLLGEGSYKRERMCWLDADQNNSNISKPISKPWSEQVPPPLVLCHITPMHAHVWRGRCEKYWLSLCSASSSELMLLGSSPLLSFQLWLHLSLFFSIRFFQWKFCMHFLVLCAACLDVITLTLLGEE